MSHVANILDEIHTGLDPRVWNDPESDEPTLKPQHADFIKHAIYSALEQSGYARPKTWLHLVLTGSLTTYQFSNDSDVDVSLFINSEVFPEWSRAEMIAVMIEHCDGKKLPGTPFPLQDFVVQVGIKPADLYRPGLRSGWDIDMQRWINPPERDRTHDVKAQENGAYVYALEQADKMERLLRYEPEKAKIFWHQIHSRRRNDMAKGKGDFADSNIVYKFLANRGLFPSISEATGEYLAKTADSVTVDKPVTAPLPSVGPSWSWPEPSAKPEPVQWTPPPKQGDPNPIPSNWKPGTNNQMWMMGHPGKGFILQDGTVWNWRTDHMQPIHTQMETRARMRGAAPVKRGTEFHIEPTGRVWQFGQGRSLDSDDLQTIQRTPTIWTGEALDPSAPVQTDAQGHAIRLMGGVAFPPPEQLQAYQDANAGQDLQNLPGAVRVGGDYGRLQFHSNAEMQQTANAYNAANGFGAHPNTYVKVNPDNAASIAQEYERMPHDPHNPEVANAYETLKNEVRAQYDHAVNNGYSFEFYPQNGQGEDPYPNSPREAVMDLHHNKHMYVYPTAAGFGSTEAEYPNHPLMGDTGIRWNGQPVYHNDLFRAIHDFYGHAKEGLGFRADGEDNAYRQHQAMFSPQARRALASETRGQNSWVNYGPYGLQNQTASTADTVFAPQKAGLMPDWTTDPDIHANAPVTSSAYYEGIVRDGGRYPPTHDYDEPWVEDSDLNL